MRKMFVVFGLVCFLESVTGCGAMNAQFNSKLEKDSLLRQITLDHPTDAAKMNRACRNAVPEVSSDLHVLSESSDLIAFSNTGSNEFFFGTGEEYQLVIRCSLLPSKKHILIDANEHGPPGSLRLANLKDKFEQMVGRVARESQRTL